jgi:superfamily II DNA/RNA helicase
LSSRTHQHPPTRPAPLPSAEDHSATVSGRFAELGVPGHLVKALATTGVTEPFPIQSAAIPDGLAGRDVLGRAHTGSGKTVAFAVPVVVRLTAPERSATARRPAGLILVPTRELATQVSATVSSLARAAGLRVATIMGGVSVVPQIKALRQGVDIVVATPGRLEDLIAQGHCRLGDVEITVLDEADQMADLGFLPAVRRLLAQTPPDSQRLLFSATLDGAVDVLAREYLRDPVTHSMNSADAGPALLEHHLLTIPHADRLAAVAELVAGHDRCLLFTRTKHGARKLARQLISIGIEAEELHSNLTQSARQRNLAAFASGKVSVLVATDIAARGIHIDEVGLVVHVDPPAEHKAYLHRSGRTARAGARGTVVTVATPEQNGDVRALLRKAKVTFSLLELDGQIHLPSPAREVSPVARKTQPERADRRPRNGSVIADRPSSSTRSRHNDGPSSLGSRRGERLSRPVRSRPAAESTPPPAYRKGAEATAGTVRWFHEGRGYGFITPDGDSTDIFVHHSSIQDGGPSKVLSPGQRVHFEAAPGAKGTQATKVRAA